METIELDLPSHMVRRQAGRGWHFFLPDEIIQGDDEENPERSSLRLFEDGVALGPAHSLHADIRENGGGAYSHWKRELFFSTSDNSDLRQSGRRYTVRAQSHRRGGEGEANLRLTETFQTLTAAPHHYHRLSIDEVQTSISLASKIVEQIIELVPPTQREEELNRFSRRLGALKDTIFDDVSQDSRTSPAYDEAVDSHLIKFRDHRAIHLELGTYVVWPKNKAEAYIVQHELGDFIRLDMNRDFGPDIVASVTALPFADETIDVISSNSLLEHVPYPHDAIREAFRVLRPGGVMMVTVPFHFVAHGCPNDYLRYTGQFFEEVCTAAGFESVTTDTWASSGVYSTLHQLLKGVTASGHGQSPTGSAGQMVHLTMMALLAALQSFDDRMDGGGPNHWIGTRALAVKAGKYVPSATFRDRTKSFVERFAEALICPATGLPLVRKADTLVSVDGSCRYDVVDGVPDLFVMHGFGSSFAARASSRERRAAWERRTSGLK